MKLFLEKRRVGVAGGEDELGGGGRGGEKKNIRDWRRNLGGGGVRVNYFLKIIQLKIPHVIESLVIFLYSKFIT